MDEIDEKTLRSRVEYLPAAACVCVFIVVLGRCAWLCDDAFITFRTVENFINGHGLRWNVAERVQSYSHPLWMFLLSGMYWVTREFYYSSILLCSVLSVAAVVICIARLAVGPIAALLGAALFTMSKAFVDFSVSGLENPLSHLLLVWFVCVYIQRDERPRRLLLLALIASLILLNRMDLALIVLPPLALAFYEQRGVKTFGLALLGFSPFIAWEIFSLVYYGSFFPNTAYAKLTHDIAQFELVCRGLKYLLATLVHDPLTLVVLGVGVMAPFITRQRRLLPLALGAVLYVAYTLHIGGDFMLGRFLAAPFLIGVILLTRCKLTKQTGGALILAALIVGLGTSRTPLFSGEEYGYNLRWIDEDGICDERGYYYHATGLLRVPIQQDTIRYTFADLGRRARERGEKVVIARAVGIFGYYAGPDVHVVDEAALTDPLLARLKPAPTEKKWRAGHLYRESPEGYIETLETGVNRIADPRIAELYDKLCLITRGDLWDSARLKTILDLNRGGLDYLLEELDS